MVILLRRKHKMCRWTNNVERSRRPEELLTPENTNQVLKIVFNNQKFKFTDILKIQKEVYFA